ncbi:MAG TPA: IS110 family transposase [Phycisphaerae bacterium]|nr:IS110 family transposase [Phycisphaerae bacterium]
MGIDWSDQALDYQLRSTEGHVLRAGQVKPTLEGIGELFAALEAHGAPAEFDIAVETAHGAWVQALLDRGYVVYPVNPKTADAFREALSAAGNKSDRIDAQVLAMFLAACHTQLRPLQPDDPEIITLRIACEDRLRLVHERTAKLNELRAVLKVYYPAFLACFDDLSREIGLKLLLKCPTQNALRGHTPRRLRNWLQRQGYPRADRVDKILAALKAPVLPVAEHLQAAKAPLVRYLAQALIALKAEIAERDEEIRQHFDRMPEADWLRSLPGSGPVLAPALLACIGRDPQRFPTAADARAFMGTAPVTKTSGGNRMRCVQFRRGCWMFARRTLQLLAQTSLRSCPWAQTFYRRQRDSGHRHHAALRALAHKWLKIILAMKRTGSRYDEHVFTHSQDRYLLNSERTAAIT